MTPDHFDRVEYLLLLPSLFSLVSQRLSSQRWLGASTHMHMNIVAGRDTHSQILKSWKVAGGNHSGNVVNQKTLRREEEKDNVNSARYRNICIVFLGVLFFLEIQRSSCAYHFKISHGINLHSLNTRCDKHSWSKIRIKNQIQLSICTLHNTVIAKIIFSQEQNIDSCLPLA